MQKYLKLVPPNLHLLGIGRFWDREMGVSRPFGSSRMTEGASSTSQGIAGALLIIRSAILGIEKIHQRCQFAVRNCSKIGGIPANGSKCIFMLEQDPAITIWPHLRFSFFSLYLPCWAGGNPVLLWGC